MYLVHSKYCHGPTVYHTKYLQHEILTSNNVCAPDTYYLLCAISISILHAACQRFVVPECVLVAGLDCFAVLWAESHLSERVVCTTAIPIHPM
jgi:hypothetical protein